VKPFLVFETSTLVEMWPKQILGLRPSSFEVKRSWYIFCSSTKLHFGLLYGMAILRALRLVYELHEVFLFRDIDSSASTELHPFV
jgi:hypothetical protein